LPWRHGPGGDSGPPHVSWQFLVRAAAVTCGLALLLIVNVDGVAPYIAWSLIGLALLSEALATVVHWQRSRRQPRALTGASPRGPLLIPRTGRVHSSLQGSFARFCEATSRGAPAGPTPIGYLTDSFVPATQEPHLPSPHAETGVRDLIRILHQAAFQAGASRGRLPGSAARCGLEPRTTGDS
jgi:hypothetical protein